MSDFLRTHIIAIKWITKQTFKKLSIAALSFSVISACTSPNSRDIHEKAILIDTHNDILMKVVDDGVVFDQDLSGITHTDLNRWKKGGLDVQVFSVYSDGDSKNAFAIAMQQMDSLDAVTTRNPNKIQKASNSSDILRIVNDGKIAALFGVEGGHMIENDLNNLDSMFSRGTRYLTLTHNIAPDWATSAADETTNPDLPHKGLTDFGIQVVKRMNALGMLIDVSHAGDQTFWDIIKHTNKPIIASHSSVFSLVPSRRNLKDDQIKAIAKNGGVIQVNMNPGFIDSTFDQKEAAFLERHKAESDSLLSSGKGDWYMLDYLYKKYAAEIESIRPPLKLYIDHIDYIAKLVGVDYVGIGSDFDGINLTPLQLDDVRSYPNVTQALLDRGYSETDIYKILGGNFMRVLKANEH
ncbi:membrane dipeptidase [bacterium]|nr:MAG: membrane dipeptidase [bacterium]